MSSTSMIMTRSKTRALITAEQELKCAYCDETTANHTKYCPAEKLKMDENSVFLNKVQLQTKYGKKIYHTLKKVNLLKGKYMVHAAEQGNMWLIRNKNDLYQYLFMHSDDWGQYCNENINLPLYKAFIDGYTEEMMDKYAFAEKNV